MGHGLFSRPFTVGHMVIRPYDPCPYCTTAKGFIRSIRNIAHNSSHEVHKIFARTDMTAIYSIQDQWDLVM